MDILIFNYFQKVYVDLNSVINCLQYDKLSTFSIWTFCYKGVIFQAFDNKWSLHL